MIVGFEVCIICGRYNGPTEGGTWLDAQLKMNLLMSDLYEWLNLNCLPLNLEKTQFVTFGLYRDSLPVNCAIRVGNSLIPQGIKV